METHGFQVLSSPRELKVAMRFLRGWCATPSVALSWRLKRVVSSFFVSVLKQNSSLLSLAA